MPYALIMAGGVGQRLWPRSRRRRPKQSLAIGGQEPLLRQAVERLLPLFDLSEILIVTCADQAEVVREIVPELPPGNLLVEPVGRNTAPCIGFGAAVIRRREPDATMVVLSADHVIRPVESFLQAVRAGCAAVEAEPQALLCLGVVPAGVSSQLGHIRRGALVAAPHGVPVYEAQAFIEKPPQPEAQRLVATGEVYWNTGIFIWKAARVLEELAANRPALAGRLAVIEEALGTGQRDEVVSREYPELESISIDYAVMEHAERVLVVEGPFQWDDVGTWDSLSRVYEDDGAGNIVLGAHVGLDTTNCVIAGEPGQVIATIGVDNLVIVQTPDAVLICPRSRAAEVRDLVARLQTDGLDEHL